MFTPRSAALAAFSCGDLRSLIVRSGRSGAVWVLQAEFSSQPAAGRFAAQAARAAGRSVALRPGPGARGDAWSVSCPVAWRYTRGPVGAGRVLAVADPRESGDVVELSALLASAGML